MAFDGTEGEVVSLNEAAGWTANYRDTIEPGDIIGHFYGKEKISALLNQTDCVGIRIYHGIDDDGQKNLILVGTNANGDDLTNIVVERGSPCPPTCSRANSLNS